MNKYLRRIGAEVLHAVGYYRALVSVDARRGRRLLVLMYHDVIADEVRARGETIDEESPTASQFAAVLDALRGRFRVLTLRDAVAEMTDGGLEDDAVAITFDDGYASVYEHAFPLLSRHEFPATVFVLTGWISRDMSFWWHRLRGLIGHAPVAHSDLPALEQILGVEAPRGTRPGSHDFRVRLSRAAEERLRSLDEQTRRDVIDRLRDRLLPDGGEATGEGRAMTWEQLRELAGAGIELAAHTRSHVDFSFVDPEVAGREAAASKRHIEDETGHPVVGFAYPYGKDIARYREFHGVLENEGFTYACTAVAGNNRDTRDLMSLRRVAPPVTSSRALIEHELSRAFVRDNSFFDARSGRTS